MAAAIYRRDSLYALNQPVELNAQDRRIIGSKGETAAASRSVRANFFGLPLITNIGLCCGVGCKMHSRFVCNAVAREEP